MNPSPTAATPSATVYVSVAAPAPTVGSLAEPAPAPAVAELVAKFVPLPGATGPVSTDYIVYDQPRARVWVPVGDTGSADVFEIAAHSFTRVDGFKTAAREAHGKKRMMGPSAATLGDGVVYIGNRATSEVCGIDEVTLKRGPCLKLPTPTDGVVYVATTKEVWVTTPRDQSLTVLDASKPNVLKPKLVIKTPGQPEGYAVDEAAGLFFTNLEDKNQTLVIDLKSHETKANWAVDCGEAGPRGVALDSARHFVLVACTSSVQVLDSAHGGALLGTLSTGAGVDNIDYDAAKQQLYVAAGKAARLTVARIDDMGHPSVIATGATVEGTRNAVADANGNVYVVDPMGARLLIFAPHTLP